MTLASRFGQLYNSNRAHLIIEIIQQFNKWGF